MENKELNKIRKKINSNNLSNKSTSTNISKRKKILIKLSSQILITIILFLIGAIILKTNLKDIIKDKIFNSNFSFASINATYKKYFGNIIPLEGLLKEKIKPVFNEKLDYQTKEAYLDGVKLTVNTNYLVPILESGIVVFIGEKENLGKTVIIQQVNGIDLWYGNLNTINVNIYDYVEKGSLLGEIKENTLYLVYEKEGKKLDYNEYIK